MKSLYLYFKFLFADDEQLITKWGQLSDVNVSGKSRDVVAKELQKRAYRYDGVSWAKSST
jgi:hypothetical protein